jgi:poly-gamma-glutamate system protein
LLCGLSLFFLFLSKVLPFRAADAARAEMTLAAQIMAQASGAIAACREESSIGIVDETDPNRTGLIGREFSPITTSTGDLEAKRTTTNPNMAALVVFLLREAGVRPGDTIAVGASGSFPASIVATLSAAKAMRLKLRTIVSLGSSQWGANDPGFHWLHMQGCLERAGIVETGAVGLSLGGDSDTGVGMTPEAVSELASAVASSGVRFLRESDLRRNVETRMRLYGENADTLRAFVHIGGAWANMGDSPQVLELRPGLTPIGSLPAPEQRGVLYEMAAQDVPVIHLLFIRGLVQDYGLPWDPRPLPALGEGEIYRRARTQDPRFLVVAGAYFLLVALAVVFKDRIEAFRK